MKFSAISTRASGLFRDLLDFCITPQCASCEAPAAGEFLCRDCTTRLESLAAAPACELCAMPLTLRDAPCPHCLGKGVPHYESIVTLGKFDEPIKDLIHRMKYRGQWPIADHLADRVMQKNRAIEVIGLADCIVPVPLHRLRQFQRGYNQAHLIATRLAPDRIARPAIRKRNTPTQTNVQSRHQRAENLKDAFKLIDPDAIAGKNVVVVDDVMTSGTTLQSLARTLIEARPKTLRAVVLARADPKGRGFEVI
jgi:ComF family protein